MDETIFIKKIISILKYFQFQLIFLRPSPKQPEELKWERKAVSCKCQKCHYINGSRLDSTPQTEVLIEPFDALYI